MLTAFLDLNLRVGGQLQEALSFERKHPILLPAQCKFTVDDRKRTSHIVTCRFTIVASINSSAILASKRKKFDASSVPNMHLVCQE